MREVELFPVLCQQMQLLGNHVFSEVKDRETNRVADVMMFNENTQMFTNIELKLGLSWTVLDQSMFWQSKVNVSYVAILLRKSRLLLAQERVFNLLGIGVLEIDVENQKVYETVKPRVRKLSDEDVAYIQTLLKGEQLYWNDGGGTTKETVKVCDYNKFLVVVYDYLRRVCENKDAWISKKELQETIGNKLKLTDEEMEKHFNTLDAKEEDYIKQLNFRNDKYYYLEGDKRLLKLVAERESKWQKT